MATWTPTADLPAPTRTRPRIFPWIVLALLFVLLGALAYAYHVAHSALPQLDGRVSLPGLSAPVTVVRDGHGVPAIEAGTLEDLFFAQGYVTAQDRLVPRCSSTTGSSAFSDCARPLKKQRRHYPLKTAAASKRMLAA
ncbi:MAG: hypothetical protein DMG81_01425 [Acidobacteria bacterium]|nr:MAG: hypothetical protein DMG81_01425 [Acidobacteriota bacterium]